MDSPSIQITHVAEESAFDVDGPPSSPFVSEVDAASRSPSKQYKPSFGSVALDAIDENAATPQKPSSPDKADIIDFTDFMDDKENVPEDENNNTNEISASPKKVATPGSIKSARSSRSPAPPSTVKRDNEERRGSEDSDLMPPPPPSIRKTPRKTPLQSLRSGENTTPRTVTRNKSFERADPTPRRTPSQFQAGLDLRNSTLQAPDTTNVDDTCFSAFSEVPEMTLFAKLGQSPTRKGDMTRTPGRDTAPTPSTSRKRPSPSRSPSPTPRRRRTPTKTSDDTTNLLLDFTQQIEGISRPSASISPSKTEPNLLKHLNSQRSPHKSRHSIATPAKQSNLLNLLDFELPPAPTPRSVPTITVRELESLKSSYLSQISSLKATLSGREAEVESLKRAVNDAERRVGEAQEELREEKDARAHAEQEKAGWEKRGQEVEVVLQSVKEEVIKGENEKEELLRKVEDTERRIEEAESRAIKAEERFADALAARADSGDGSASATEEQVQKLVAAQIDAKIEAVSRELHAVYKDKHERKVATLKKSYEARGEKRCAELQARLDIMQKENEDLHAAKDATFSGPVTGVSNEESASMKAEMEEQRAHLARLENEIRTSQQQQAQLVSDLERERIEKGDLVAAVDEMLALQSEAGPSQAQGAMSAVEDFRKSISSKPSGLKPPGESRIGRGGATPASRGPSGKSRMLANIERMGRTNGGGE